MAKPKDETVDAAQHMPPSADQAPAGDATAPGAINGWTGEPDPGARPDHPTEAAAEAHGHHGKGLVKVKKDDQELHIHPDTLKAHKAAGWREVE
jgi:hypothetical protein